MEYIYAPDADEVLDAENRARFLDLKNCLLPEIEIVQMWYVTEAFNTVMNVKRELRPKLFKRLRTFTWTLSPRRSSPRFLWPGTQTPDMGCPTGILQ